MANKLKFSFELICFAFWMFKRKRCLNFSAVSGEVIITFINFSSNLQSSIAANFFEVPTVTVKSKITKEKFEQSLYIFFKSWKNWMIWGTFWNLWRCDIDLEVCSRIWTPARRMAKGIKTKFNRKSSNFIFKWTKTLHQNISKYRTVHIRVFSKSLRYT